MKKFGLLMCLVLVTAGLAACLPSFPTGGVLTVTPSGSGGTLSWPPAIDADAGQTIASYRIDVDGTEVSRVHGSESSCLLSGLSSGSHAVAVTAYDSHGDWSGTASSGPSVTAEVTAPNPVSTSVPIACVAVVPSSEDSITIDDVVVSVAVDPSLGVSASHHNLGVGAPAGVDLRVSELELYVSGIVSGGVGEVSLGLSEPVDAVRVLAEGAWGEFDYDESTGARVAGDGLTIVVGVQDGGRGDADGRADGAVTVSLGLGVARAVAVSPSAPAGVPDVPLPQTAPGWSEARPAITKISGGTFGKLVVLRINASGALQYELQLSGANLFSPFTSLGQWTDWTTIEGTGDLVGSPAISGTTVYARGADGSLKRIQMASNTFPVTSPAVVTSMSQLPNGLSFAGSPSVGSAPSWMMTITGSDGRLWMTNQSTPGGTWEPVPGSGTAASGSAGFATRADGTGADLWIHNSDHSRRQVSYTASTGWDSENFESDAGPWAGSPSATKLLAASGGTSVTALADVDPLGRIVTEVLRGTPARFVNGSGFVGSTAMVNSAYVAVLAAVRVDGAVTLRLLTPAGDLNPAGGLIATIGAPGPASFKTPTNGSTVAPGTAVTMTVGSGVGATDYHWKLNDVPDSGDPVPVASASLPASTGLTWTVPASLLQDGHRYQWRAEAYRSDNGLTAPTDLQPPWYGFTVTSGLAPVQTSPEDGANAPIDANGAVTLVASPVPGATGYRFSVYGDTGAPFVRNTTTSTWVMTGWFGDLVAPGTTQSWSVQAVFGSTVGAPSPKRSFTAVLTNSGPPATPTLSSPADAALADAGAPLRLVVDFPPDNHKKEFRFELWEDTATGRRWVTGRNSPFEVWTVPAGTMEPNRTYDWTVRVYDYATAQLSSWPTPRLISTSTDYLGPGSVLTSGNHLRSPNGYRLEMQPDGNVVVYMPNGDVQAATNRLIPEGSPFPYLVMQGDGNLVEYQDVPGSERNVIWASGSFGPDPHLGLQPDGNAVVYKTLPGNVLKPMWASNSLVPRPPPPPPTTGGTKTIIVGGVPFSGARLAATTNAEPWFTLSAEGLHPTDTLSFAVTLPGTGLPQLNSAQINAAQSGFTLELVRLTTSGATTIGTLNGLFSQAEKPQHRLGNLVYRGTKSGMTAGEYEIRATYQHPTLTSTPVSSSAKFTVYSPSTPIPGTVSTANLAAAPTMLRGVCGSAGGYAVVVGITGQICMMAELKPTGNVLIDLAAIGLPVLQFTGNVAIYGTVISSAGVGYDLSGLAVLSVGSFYDFDSMDSCISGGAGIFAGGFCWKDTGHFPSVGLKAAIFAGLGLGSGFSVALADHLWYGVFTDRWYCQGRCGPEA